jgi:hypothetical protein
MLSWKSGRISGIRPSADIRPDIQYPAFRLAGYPAKSVSGESLVIVAVLRKAAATARGRGS